LIPELKKVNPSLTETVTRMMGILREEEGYFDLLVTKALMRMITRKREGYIELFLSPMETLDRVLLRRVLRRAIDEIRGLKRISFIHIEDMLELIKKGKAGDRLYLPEDLRVIKGYSTLIITTEPPVKIERYSLTVPGETMIKEKGFRIKAEVLEEVEELGNGKDTIVLDADKTGKDLHIRPRESGDFFYPLGFGRRKKLQDFFVDEKIPRDERDTIPLVLSGNDIIWVVGFRGDERFKVTKDTKSFLRLKVLGGT
ncbi:MAG: tRNA lysidine(34) synthetase TilS, partial [Thermodesulfovibrionales bacterium]